MFFSPGDCLVVCANGTLLFLYHGAGSMEPLALGGLLVHHSGWGLTGGGRDRAADLLRERWEEADSSAACVAAGCDGRAYAGVGADSRGNDGGGGCLSSARLYPLMSAECPQEEQLQH